MYKLMLKHVQCVSNEQCLYRSGLQPHAVAGEILPSTGHCWISPPGPVAADQSEASVTLRSPGIRDVCVLHAELLDAQHV